MEGLYYNAPITAGWMLLSSAALELPEMLALHARARAAQPAAPLPTQQLLAGGARALLEAPAPQSPLDVLCRHPGTFFAAGALGVAVNLSSMLMIKYTGSVSLKLLAAARNAGLVLYAVLVCGEATTPTQVGGYAICVVFFCAYVLHKASHVPPK